MPSQNAFVSDISPEGFQTANAAVEKLIAKAVVELLKRCPAKAVATRKELLVATSIFLQPIFAKVFSSM